MAKTDLIDSEAVARRADLVRYASRVLGSRDHAEDVVQEAYLRLGEAAGKRLLEQPVRYLTRIVRNLALDRLWGARQEARHFVTAGEDALLHVFADHPSPEDEMLSQDELARVGRALAELPERTRIAVEMHRFAGARLREIADELGVSVSLAHQLVADGVAHCRQRVRSAEP